MKLVIEVPSPPKPPKPGWLGPEPPPETERHRRQMEQLIATLRWRWRARTDVFVGGNMTIYYATRQPSPDVQPGPDVFVAFHVDGKRRRRYWVKWKDGVYPHVVIELVSPATAELDRGAKMRLYAQTFRVPEYFLFDPDTLELEGYSLDSSTYVPIEPDSRGRLSSHMLKLLLGVHEGWLRLYTPGGRLLPLPEVATAAARRPRGTRRSRARSAGPRGGARRRA